MIIFFWILTLLLFSVSLTAFILLLLRRSKGTKDTNILMNGFIEALHDCGWQLRRHRYPVELYKWEVTDYEKVCEDGLERENWPPMDIAEWIKAGLPGTPEAGTRCGSDCSCRIVRCKESEISKTRK